MDSTSHSGGLSPHKNSPSTSTASGAIAETISLNKDCFFN